MVKRFNRFQWAILIISILLWAGCAQNPYYVNDLREDEALTRPFKEAAVRIAQANGMDVSGMKVFLSDNTNVAAMLFSDGSGIVLASNFAEWVGDNKSIIYSVIAHELAHKKLGHTFSSKKVEFEADREAVRMLEKVGLGKENYLYQLRMAKRTYRLINKGDDEYHPSIDERIKRLES